jgi:hypothetical protein
LKIISPFISGQRELQQIERDRPVVTFFYSTHAEEKNVLDSRKFFSKIFFYSEKLTGFFRKNFSNFFVTFFSQNFSENLFRSPEEFPVPVAFKISQNHA